MKLYLVRHGESIASGSDDERPLSENGKKEIEQLAHFLAPLKLHTALIFQSPKLRAQQTAKILSSVIAVTQGIETRVDLEPLAPITHILDEIVGLNEDVILVGHMPFMGKLFSQLITHHDDKDVVMFKPGSMVCFERMAESQWVIRWMLNPELFNKR